MIYELRIYTCHPGAVAKVLAMWQEEGQEMLAPYFNLKGQWVSESGTCNQIYSLWEFEDMNHRNEMRRQLLQHPGFMDYLERCRAHYVSQEAIFLRPTDLSPLK
ncbi:NIPSNAP family protein [Cerasicoccus frondis]|uniref:NIPSNAP family protein n=1 Tax=Cerasicoccus frondis TaxID=490090 RepID=UPI00285292B4|nr:NIPSNAP family protein [Cerasicoccus frondis]